MHVRATNADRKSIKRLLHPRHSAASSSSWEPASFFSLYPSSRFLSRLSLPSLPPLLLLHPPTLYRTSVPSTLFPGEKVSFKWPSKLENHPPKMHFTFQRCSFLLEEDVFRSTENIPSLVASVYFSSCLSPCSCALFSTFFL